MKPLNPDHSGERVRKTNNKREDETSLLIHGKVIWLHI